MPATTINEYIAGFPRETQKVLKQIRSTIKKAVPAAAVEVISYGIPSFKLNGKGLIYYAAFKKHIGLYPAPKSHEAFKKELAAYKGGKGTVQFPLDQPMPLTLITRIVKFKVKENLQRTKQKDK